MDYTYPIQAAFTLFFSIIGIAAALLAIGLMVKQPDEWEDKYNNGKDT
jgi:hypothetical protein